MNARIRAHIEAVEERLAGIDGDRERLSRLADYHHRQTQNFQHERLIHLLVTFFFGGLAVAALAALAWFLAAGDPDGPTLAGLIALNLMLLGLEAAYIGHYYGLENNVQRLYGLTTRLFEAAEAQRTPSGPGA
ncbi:MAG: hypothetical protein LBC97_06140 [Bifidobacteriaceae bacterium]|nr:hypothetical protein [Bifidobacteriaceae bacterium]